MHGVFLAQLTHKDIIIVWKICYIEVNFRIYVPCIFVKKQGFNSFSSIGRVEIFLLESKKNFVKRQPHLFLGYSLILKKVTTV